MEKEEPFATLFGAGDFNELLLVLLLLMVLSLMLDLEVLFLKRPIVD